MADVVRIDSGEWARLRALRLVALADAPDAFGSTSGTELAYDEEEWRHLLGLGPWWVATGPDGDVGLVAGGTTEDEAVRWVYSMWVDDAHRGRGIADALLDCVIEWAVDDGATTLGLDVTDRASRARRFYERMGFVMAAASTALPRDPSIRLFEMRLDLHGRSQPTES